jgi:Domain of unknown function (DUF397).
MTLARAWRKSVHSTGSGNNCVEICRPLPGVVAVRDSKRPDGPTLRFSAAEWRAFVHCLKSGGRAARRCRRLDACDG